MYSPEELNLIHKYTNAGNVLHRYLNNWVAEIVLPMILAGYGILAQKDLYVILAIAGLIFFNSLCIFRQYKNFGLQLYICKKIEARGGNEGSDI